MTPYLLPMLAAIIVTAFLSRGIERGGLTLPALFLGLGMLAAEAGLDLAPGSVGLFHTLAEGTLAVMLFADATELRRDTIARIETRTLRLLGLGLPLSILIGAGAGALLLPGWPLWEILLLAALLAPTDAALSQAVMTNRRVPETLRGTLNAESGLNDGLALPFVILFASLASGQATAGETGPLRWLALLALEIGGSAALGLALGAGAGLLGAWAAARRLTAPGLDAVAVLALVALTFLLAGEIGVNRFVALFCAGAAYGLVPGPRARFAREMLESYGTGLTILCFAFIGAVFVPEMRAHLTAGGLVLAVLALVLVRPLAVALALTGSATPWRETLFLGWFGPRGLATALFAVFVMSGFPGLADQGGLIAITTTTVVLSALLHGLSARFADRLL